MRSTKRYCLIRYRGWGNRAALPPVWLGIHGDLSHKPRMAEGVVKQTSPRVYVALPSRPFPVVDVHTPKEERCSSRFWIHGSRLARGNIIGFFTLHTPFSCFCCSTFPLYLSPHKVFL